MIETVTVDKDVLSFLRAIYFGAYGDAYEAAGNRAYRDMNRTIRFNGMAVEKRSELRSKTINLLRTEISQFINKPCPSQKSFDEWHYSVCSKIRRLYCKEGVSFTFGQAQKWVNMTCKYLFIIGETDFANCFAYLHIPLDNYIFEAAKKELEIPKPGIAWSRWDDYHSQYMRYQEELRSRIRNVAPLRWEFTNWLKVAREL